ncbi:MAG: hypothetical protein H6732_14780 [Alphaproteobacteria bacterium]|nr:hypothetical protein [Alphaproteobacteria bacterium]
MDATRAPAPPSSRLSGVALAVLVLATGLWRASRLTLDVTHDELALVSTQGPWAVWGWSEGGINPPLLPLLANLLPVAQVIPVGRAVTLAAGLATLGVVGLLCGRLAGAGRPWQPLLAVGVLAVAPIHAVASTELRAYAWWALVAALHLDATDRALRPGARTGVVAAWAATLSLQAWLHYLAWPLALAEVAWLATRGAEGRRLLRALPGVALSWLPLVWLVVAHGGARRAQGDVLESYALMATGGLGAAGTALGVAVALAITGLLALSTWRRLPPVGQLATVLLGVGLAVLPLAGLAHTVRPPVALLVLLPWAVVLGALPLAGAARTGAWVLAAGAALCGMAPHGGEQAFRGDDPRAVGALVDDWGAWVDVGLVEAWVVDDPTLLRVCYQATGAYPVRRPGGGEPGCDHAGVRLRRIPDPPRDGWLLRPQDRHGPGAPEDCVVAVDHGPYAVWRCGDPS